jgi:hypothetical protein
MLIFQRFLLACAVSPLRIRPIFNDCCFVGSLFRVVPRYHPSVFILVASFLPTFPNCSSSEILLSRVPTYAELHALSYSSLTMATKIDTATVTGADVRNDASIKRSGGSHVSLKTLNGFKAPQPLAPIRTHMKKKYRHVAAVHSKPRTSCLSHDSQVSPSFLGFRNLMVIVLGMLGGAEAFGVESNNSNSCRKLTFDD